MKIKSSDYIKNNIPSAEMYKFFEDTPKRKASPKSKQNASITSKLPLRRSTRLKSIYLENCTNKMESEYDITKEDFHSSTVEYVPLKKKASFSKSNCNKINEILDKIVAPLDNAAERNGLGESGHQEIDTKTTLDMMHTYDLGNKTFKNNPRTESFYQKEGKIPETATVSTETPIENYSSVNETLHVNSEVSTNDNVVGGQLKKRRRKPNCLKNSTDRIKKNTVNLKDIQLKIESHSNTSVQPKKRPRNTLKTSESLIEKVANTNDKQNAPITSKLPLRRSTRLKSVLNVENFTEMMDSEYDTTKEDFHSSTVEYVPLKEEENLLKSEINEILDKIVVPLDNAAEHNGLENSGYQEMADNVIGGIDNNTTLDRMHTCDLGNKTFKNHPRTESFYQKEGEIPETATVSTKTLTENYSSVNEALHDNNVVSTNNNGQPKNRGRNENCLKNLTDAIKKCTVDLKDIQLEIESHSNTPVQPKKRRRIANTLKTSESIIEKDANTNDKQNAPITSKLPLRRSTRLKSVLNVENFTEMMDSEYDTTKEDFHSSTVEYVPLKEKENLSKSEINEILDKIVVPLDNAAERNGLGESGHQEIDTNITVDMTHTYDLGNKIFKNHPRTESFYQKGGRIPENATVSTETLTENYSSVNEPLHDNNEVSTNNNAPGGQPKKRGRKPNCLKNSTDGESHSNTPVQPKKRGRKPNTFENSESISEKDGNANDKQLEIDSHTSTNPVQPKKRGRKPNSFKNSTITIERCINVDDKQIDKESHEDNKSVLRKSKRLPEQLGNVTSKDFNITDKSSPFLPPRNKNYKLKKKKIVRKAKHSGKMLRMYTKKCKLTKTQIKHVPPKKIPKDRLMDALEMVHNVDHPIWDDRNKSCNTYLFNHWETRNTLVSDVNAKLKYARQFLLRRDWINLAKVLCVCHPILNFYYPLLSKYTAILLAHTDKVQFDKFIQFLTGIVDSNIVVQKCTSIPKQKME